MVRAWLMYAANVVIIVLLVTCYDVAKLWAQSDDVEALNQQVQELVESGELLETTSDLAIKALTHARACYVEEHAVTAASWRNFAEIFFRLERYVDALPIYVKVLSMRRKVLDEKDPAIAASLVDLAEGYRKVGRVDEAEGLYKEALDFLGKMRPAQVLHLGQRYMGLESSKATGGLLKPEAAERLLRQALVMYEEKFGRDDPKTAPALDRLARFYAEQRRYENAEPLLKRAMPLYKQELGAKHPVIGHLSQTLAEIYFAQARYEEAEPLFLQALELRQSAKGLKQPDTAVLLSNLAKLYMLQGRHGEVESLLQRAWKTWARELGPGHPNTARVLGHLINFYTQQNRFDDANPLYLKAVEIMDKATEGLRSAKTYEELNAYTDLVMSMSMLPVAYNIAVGRFEVAESLLTQKTASTKERYGSNSPANAANLEAFSDIYYWQGHHDKAESVAQQALDIWTKTLGPEHPDTAFGMNKLASLHIQRQDWKRAWVLAKRAVDIRIGRFRNSGKQATGRGTGDRFGLKSPEFSTALQAASGFARLAPQRIPELADESYLIGQWRVSTQAGTALAQMAHRYAKGQGKLANLIRQHQDIVVRLNMLNRDLVAEVSKPQSDRQPEVEADIRQKNAELTKQLITVTTLIRTTFPAYAALTQPEPLSIAETRALLKPNEALVFVIPGGPSGSLVQPGPSSESWAWRLAWPSASESWLWVITATEARWQTLPVTGKTLSETIAALRCGLDADEWGVPTRQRRCARLLGLNAVPDEQAPLPFHLGKAYDLYQALFGSVEKLIKGKHLLVVPSGPLTSLPFHVLVTEPPDEDLPSTFEGYRNIPWLGRHHAITVLPAVSSLNALRRQASSEGASGRRYLGYGNPVLLGNGNCRAPQMSDQCPSADLSQLAAATGRATIGDSQGVRSASMEEIYAKGAVQKAVLQKVRQQCPLPDTGDEIRCIAEHFPQASRLIRLGSDARETDLKARSESGELADYAVLHFATHGLLSGDVARIALRQGEPALVLTPPDKPIDDDDDGLLMASEVAGLKLNADWVVLSACNTAAGEDVGSEALSGLARAFFYAGGRTLLVSHWPVYSDAAVRLTTHAFAELDRDARAGRAEALRRAMVALMKDLSQEDNAHPAVWAPFVVIGEGAR